MDLLVEVQKAPSLRDQKLDIDYRRMMIDMITDCLDFVREFNQVIQQIRPWSRKSSARKVVLSRPLKDLDEVLSDLSSICARRNEDNLWPSPIEGCGWESSSKKRNEATHRLNDYWKDLDITRKKVGNLQASLAAITAIQKLVDSESQKPAPITDSLLSL